MLAVVDTLLHAAGDAERTLRVLDVVAEFFDFFRHLILCIFNSFLLLSQLLLLRMQLHCLLLNLLRLLDLRLLAVVLLLMSQHVEPFTLFFGLGLSVSSLMCLFHQLITE